MMRFFFYFLLSTALCIGNATIAHGQNSQKMNLAQALQGMDIGDSLSQLGIFQQARQHYHRSKVFFEQREDWPNYVKAQNSLFNTWAALEKYREGEPFLRQALAQGIPHLGERSLALADTYANLGTYFDAVGELDSQLIYVSLALDIQQDSLPHNHPALIATHSNLGMAYKSYGDYDLFLEHSRKSFEIISSQEEADLFTLAIIAHNYGGAHREMGNYTEAVKLTQFAIEILQDSLKSKHPALGSLYNALGEYHHHLGKGKQAVAYILEALRIRQEMDPPNPNLVARSHFTLAKAYKRQDQPDQALEHYHYALDVYEQYRQGPNYSQGSVALSLAGIYLAQDMVDTAEKYLEITEENWTKILPGDHPQMLNLLTTKADIAFAQSDIAGSHALYQKALDLAEGKETLDKSILAKIYSGFAYLFRAEKNWEKAIELHQRSLYTFVFSPEQNKSESLDEAFPLERVDQIPAFLGSLKTICKTLLAAYQERREERYLTMLLSQTDLVVDLVAQLNAGFRTEDKLNIIHASRPILEAAIEGISMSDNTAFGASHFHKAFSYLECSRALQLQESLHKNRADQFAGPPEDVRQLESDIRRGLLFYRHKQRSIRIKNNSDQVKLDLWTKKTVQLEQRYDSLKQVFRTDYPEYYRLRFDYPRPSLAEVQQSLSPETVIISYFQGDQAVYGLTISKEQVYCKRLQSSQTFQNQLVRYLELLHLADPSGFLTQYSSSQADSIFLPLQVESHALYQSLLAPLMPTIASSKHLMIIPDGEIGLIPFGALSVEPSPASHYLIHRYRTSYAYGASFLAEAWQSARPSIWSKKAYGGFAPVYQSSHTSPQPLNDLPYARKEVREAAELFSGDAFLGEKASKGQFSSHASQYNILHLAMHTRQDSGDTPILVFYPSSSDNSSFLLPTSELYRYSLPNQLAVLSACNTGKGEWRSGEGIMSLAHAFAYAGCRSQVMSLWQLDDQTGSEMILDFYHHINQGQTIDQALQMAKLNFLQAIGNSRLRHPYFWATFLAVGDMQAVEVHTLPHPLWLGAILLILLSLGLLARKIIGQRN